MTKFFTATVSASGLATAIAKVEKHLAKVDGFVATGRCQVMSPEKGLYNVEILDEGGDRNDCWVVLTSYGISPSVELGSAWETAFGASA